MEVTQIQRRNLGLTARAVHLLWLAVALFACSRPRAANLEPLSSVIYFTTNDLDTRPEGSDITHRMIGEALEAMFTRDPAEAASLISLPTTEAIVFGGAIPEIADVEPFRNAYRQGVLIVFINVSAHDRALFLDDHCIDAEATGRQSSAHNVPTFAMITRYVYGSTAEERQKVMEAWQRGCGKEPSEGIRGQVYAGSVGHYGLVATEADLDLMRERLVKANAQLQDVRSRMREDD